MMIRSEPFLFLFDFMISPDVLCCVSFDLFFSPLLRLSYLLVFSRSYGYSIRTSSSKTIYIFFVYAMIKILVQLYTYILEDEKGGHDGTDLLRWTLTLCLR